MANFGFTTNATNSFGAVLETRCDTPRALLYVTPDQTVRQAIDLMPRQRDQPTPGGARTTPPFAAAEVSRSATSSI